MGKLSMTVPRAELERLGYREIRPGHWQKTATQEVRPTVPELQSTGLPVVGGSGPAVASVPRSPFASKLEAEFAGRCEARKLAGEIHEWLYEPITLKLADGVRYTPDFMVRVHNRMDLVEVKGFMREAARVRLLVAAKLYPAFRFFLARKIAGSWTVTEVPKE